MNAIAIDRALRTVVEGAVRPVCASRGRKLRMREELLAHLWAIYEEELARLADSATALGRARQRFGDPKVLQVELQEAVSRWDHLQFLSEKLDYQPGEPLLPSLTRFFLFQWSLFGLAVLALWLLELFGIGGRSAEWWLRVRIVGGLSVFVPGSACIVLGLGEQVRRALWGEESTRSGVRAAAYGVLALPVLPAFMFVTYAAWTGDFVASAAQCWRACVFAPVLPIVVFGIARHLQFSAEWTSLEIEE